jgi:hypothetical protein
MTSLSGRHDRKGRGVFSKDIGGCGDYGNITFLFDRLPTIAAGMPLLQERDCQGGIHTRMRLNDCRGGIHARMRLQERRPRRDSVTNYFKQSGT